MLKNSFLNHSSLTLELKNYVDNDPQLKFLLEKTLAKNKEINPDKNYNPAQDLESLYNFIDWSTVCMPWNVFGWNDYPDIYTRLDQSIGYFYFIFDCPLDELKDKGYFYPSLNYHEPIATWLNTYAKTWGAFLDTKESWKPEYYKEFLTDNKFNLHDGTYEKPENWKTFNDFFTRRLKNIKNSRPLGDAEVVMPADSYPKGLWPIDENSNLPEDVCIKSANLRSISDLIGGPFANDFANGYFTHTFLDVNCYHRYHSPVSGTIVDVRKIPAADAAGGVTIWDAENKRYRYLNEVGFQMIETRACLIIDTGKYGLVAMLPIGMSQICSVNFTSNIKVGNHINKGDEVGYFMFGGSDICIVLQDKVKIPELAYDISGNGFNKVRSNYFYLEKK